jgi:hypothetical protein
MLQPGVPRSTKDIRSDVDYQVELACLGVAQNVQNQQTKHGIKDGYTQSWIDNLIARARTLRKDHPERAPADIQTELLTSVHKNKNDIYNPFLTLDGESITGVDRRHLITAFFQVSIPWLTLP